MIVTPQCLPHRDRCRLELYERPTGAASAAFGQLCGFEMRGKTLRHARNARSPPYRVRCPLRTARAHPPGTLLIVGMSVRHILVYDMPRCKWFLGAAVELANLSQMPAISANNPCKWKWPRKTGAIDRKTGKARSV